MTGLRSKRLLLGLTALVVIGTVGLSVYASAQVNCSPARASDSVRLQVARREHPLIADAMISLADPAPLFLEYGNDTAGWFRSPTAPASTTHQMPILRLRADSTYQVRAFTVDAAGCPSVAAQATLTTGELPRPLELSILETVGRPSFPLALVDKGGGDEEGVRQAYILAMDADGLPVWYYQLPDELPVPPAGRTSIVVERRPNGNLLYLAGSFGFEEITPDGKIVRRTRLTAPGATRIHHDFTQLPDGRVLFIGLEDRPAPDTSVPGAPNRLRADTLHIVDLETGDVETVWTVFDNLDPVLRPTPWRNKRDQGADDLTHANSVALGPRGNVIMSFRHLDQVISISPDFKSVEWRLGGIGSSFDFPDPTDRFYGQHAVTELPGNRILMFDNGNYRPDADFSRGLELELDFGSMTARKVWEYRHQPDVYSDRISSALRLPNGNTLVNFGYNADGPGDPIFLVEARPDGSVAWSHTLKWRGNRPNRYRAYPVDSLAGEVPIQPTAVNGS